MREILFIKTSSLGDVVHHMPAVTDARRQHPEARIGWVVEESYAPLARLHPGVDEVIPVAVRRWRRSLFRRTTWAEVDRTLGLLRARAYDAVVDTQGLTRTGIITALTRGTRHGYDAASIREPLASRFYDVRHSVSRSLHAIDRNRLLTGLALGYAPDAAIDYGLGLTAPSGGYAVLLHGSARPEKEWPQESWLQVAEAIRESGLRVVLPWGSEPERLRSEALAARLPGAEVPDRRPLDEVARMLAGASLVVGLDTGLLHLAAALSLRLVGIFLGSDPALTAPRGAGRIAVAGRKGAPPSAEEVLDAIASVSTTPAG
jgi:heptosyltransferase-1